MALVSRALTAGLEFGDWRVMCGQLEHIRCVNGQPRLSQFGMYEPHRQQLGVADMVTPSPLCARSLAAWIKLLSGAGGATFLVVFRLSWAGTWAKLVVYTSSDAAREGTDTPGLGGYCNGLYWYYPLNGEQLALLTIGVLELLTAIFNILALWPLVSNFEAIAHQCDALATPMVLAEHSACSPLMQVPSSPELGRDLLYTVSRFRKPSEWTPRTTTRSLPGPASMYCGPVRRYGMPQT